ncbi:MAG: hypothetical protein ACI857_001139 [Arenicella sp.]|jgi:hypothetical protein
MLSIPEPCSEDFTAMTPTERGAFCGKCQIDTIDFRGMSNSKIKETLTQSQNEHLCGQFYGDQLVDYNLSSFSPVYRERKFLNVFLIGILTTLITSCGHVDPRNAAEVDKKTNSYLLVERKFLANKPRKMFADVGLVQVPEIELFEEEWDEEKEFVCSQKEPIEIIGKEIVIMAEYRQQLGGEIRTSYGGVPLLTREEVNGNQGFFKRLFNKRKSKKNEKD